MSLIFGIFLIYATGFSIVGRIHKSLDLPESLSLSFMAGIGVQSMFMLLADIAGVQFNMTLLAVANVAVIILLFNKRIFLEDYIGRLREEVSQTLAGISLKTIDAAAVLIWIVIATLIYVVTIKGLYWPPTEHDAIGSFDKLGILFALEGKIHISLFDYGLQGAGGVYPPLFTGGVAYFYLFGAQSPKLVTLFMNVSMLLFFYSATRRYVNALAASLATLLFMWTPEFYAHMGMLLSNLPATAYVGTTALLLFIWMKEERNDYFWLSALFAGLMIWVRNDLLPFTAAGMLVVFIVTLKNKQYRNFIVYSLISLVPLIIWTLYVKFNLKLDTAGRFAGLADINTAKLATIGKYILAYLTVTMAPGSAPGYFLYGLAFLLPLGLMFANALNWKKQWAIFVYFKVSFVLYVLLFVLIDEKKQGSDISSLMMSSFKRGMFCFVPVLMFYAATNPLAVKLWDKIDAFRSGD
jgi:hypothetical protein